MYVNPMLNDTRYPTCLAPWNALTIKWGGAVLPDIIYNGKFGNITRQTLPEILNSDEAVALRKSHADRKIPPACLACTKKEKSGKSRRMYFWDKLDEDVKRGSIKNTINSKPDIRYLDFTISNKCNLACIHCNPFVSTGWTKDGKKLNKENPSYWEQAQIGYHGVEDMSFLDNLFADPEYFRNLQWVALRGGEPLYDESCKAILQWFIDEGLAPNIMLDISTNATVFDNDFQEIFKHFKHIELLISIEAVDELYSVVRGGKTTSFTELEDNIEKFYTYDNIEVVFAVTVMITNVFGLDKVWNWFKEKHMHRASISMSNVVVNPAYLNIAYMPDVLKWTMYDKLLQIPDQSIWPKGSYHAEEIHYQTGIHAIRDGLQIEVDEVEQEKQWNSFIKYTKDLDRLRGTDTFSLIKELKLYNE